MIECGGVWLPDGEQHLVEWMQGKDRWVGGKLTYQYHKLEAALAHVQDWRTAVDVGAHCGLWSMHLARHFAFVHAFEPVAAHRECFVRNVSGEAGTDYELWPVALGERYAQAGIDVKPTSSGDSRLTTGEGVTVERFDDLLPEIGAVDLVKLDCEGYELPALRGMREMLERCRPVVVVEQKPGHGERYGFRTGEAVEFLEGLGAEVVKAIAGDYILVWA